MSAQPLRSTYSAWRVMVTGRSLPLDIAAAASLAEAINLAATFCHHKEVFHVLHLDPVTGAGCLHIYRIKQSSKLKRVPHSDGTWRVIKPLEPEYVIKMAVETFAPAEPWRWTPGADVVGHSDVIEGAAA
jgi:hypothetical protein